MTKGTIRRLMDRGYGFIKTEQGEDLFFHRSNTEGLEFNNLQEGQEVEFEKGQGRDGRPAAVKVRLAGAEVQTEVQAEVQEEQPSTEESTETSEAVEEDIIEDSTEETKTAEEDIIEDSTEETKTDEEDLIEDTSEVTETAEEDQTGTS
ncbi:cold-shock protein [Chloroflexota bacterium]